MTPSSVIRVNVPLKKKKTFSSHMNITDLAETLIGNERLFNSYIIRQKITSKLTVEGRACMNKNLALILFSIFKLVRLLSSIL